MKFVGTTGAPRKARAPAAATLSLGDVTQPGLLLRLLRDVFTRLGGVEARVQDEGVEFELEVSGAAGTHYLPHSLGPNVRWYVVDWAPTVGPPATNPTAAPYIYRDPTATKDGVLALVSNVAGKAVIRVEPSQHPLDR